MAQGPSPYASLTPSERDLDFVAGEAGGNWRSLLTHLGIKFPEIQRLFSKNDKDSRVACFEGLFTWLSSKVNDPEEPVTFGTLFQALREAKMASCVSLLEEKLEARSAHKPAGGDLSAQPGTSKSKESPAMANSSSKDHNTAEIPAPSPLLNTPSQPISPIAKSEATPPHQTTPTHQTMPPNPTPTPLDVGELLEKYKDRIYSDVMSKHISLRLEVEKVISERVALDISTKTNSDGNCLIYLDLMQRGDLKSLQTFGTVLAEEEGNAKMQRLGEDLLAEITLPHGPHSSPGDAPIEDVAFFLPYIDKMMSQLIVLGAVLGLSGFAPPGDSPSDKCFNTLQEWLKRTASPTVGKFCKCLEKASCFNRLRETILPGVGERSHSEQSPSTTELPQAKRSARDSSRAEQLHRQEYTQGHESVLLDKCFIPFGIKTVQIDQSGGVYNLEPTTDGFEDHSDNIEQQRSGGDDDEGTQLPEGTDGEGRVEENRFKIEVPDGALNQKFIEVRSAIIFSGSWRLPEGYTLASPVLYISFDWTAVTKPVIVRVPHWIAQVRSLSAEDCPLAVAPHELPEDDSKYSFSFLDQEDCSVGAQYSTIKLSGHCCLLGQAIVKSKGQSCYSATAWTRPRESLSGYLFRVPVIFNLPIWNEVLKKYFKDNNWTRDKDFLAIKFEFAPPQKHASLSGTLTKASGPGWAASLNREMLFPESYHSMKPDTLEYKLKEDEYPSSFVVTVSEWSRGQNTDSMPVSLIVSGTKLGSMEFPFPVKQAVHLSEADSLPSLRSPPTASRNGSLLEGPPAPRTGMDEKIGRGIDILEVPEYKEGLIGKMKSLGAVLGIEEDTKAILNRNGSVDDHLLGILSLYIEQKTPTWKDFCKALKRLACFNKVRAKIEADHDK